MAETDVFVSHEWLERNHAGVIPVDVRPEAAYRSAHIPGAVNVPYDSFRIEGPADIGRLPGTEVFGERLGTNGISPTDQLVAYDDSYGVYAARFLLTALVYDHEAVHVLDGDYTAWNRDRPVTTAGLDRTTAMYPTRRVEDPPIVDVTDFASAIDAGAAVVDTRVKYEYRVAHVPGAISLNWRKFVGTETRRIRPQSELNKLLEERGLAPDQRVVLYCNTARRLSFTYAVLRHLGYDRVTCYEGGLAEWVDNGRSIEATG